MTKIINKIGKRKRILVITRVSTGKQKSNTSTDSQLAWANKKADELDGDIADEISVGMSGDVFLKRYRDRILKAIEEKKIDYILVYKIDRFTRNLSQGTLIMKEILKLGCKIITPSEVIDDSSDLLMPHIEMAISEHNRKTIVERGNEGIIYLLKKGIYPFKHLPIGMKTIGDKNSPEYRKVYFDHSFDDVIIDLFQFFIETKSYASTTRKINNIYKKRFRNPLSTDRVKNALSNTMYIGFISFNGNRYGKNGSTSDPNLSLIAIDEETFETAQEVIQRIKGKRSKNVTPLKDSLGDLVETYGFDMVINYLDKFILIRCPRCGNNKLDRNGPEINQGYLLQKYKCTNGECDYQFRFPSVQQLKHLRSMDPRRCPHCGSSNNFSIKRSALSGFFKVICNECHYEWHGPDSDNELLRLYHLQMDDSDTTK